MERIFEDSEYQLYRVKCDCMWPGHALDIGIEKNKLGQLVDISLDIYLDSKPSLLFRIKQAFRLLRGKKGYMGDFCLSPEDVPDLHRILSIALQSPNTATNYA